MKTTYLWAAMSVLALGACQPVDPVLGGAATGAAIGAAVSDDGDRAEGAILGAAVGAAAGGLAGAAAQGPQCRYRYPDGSVVVRDCPPGY